MTWPVLQSLIVREGHLIVVDEGRPVDGVEGEPSLVKDNRILAVAPNYVVD